MDILTQAKTFSAKVHDGKKYNGGPFIQHPYQVYRIIETILPDDINLQAAALLHDVLEESDVPYERLNEDFNSDVADLVREVTKDGYNSFPNLHTRRGAILKFADRLSNLINMLSWSKEKQDRYLLKSKFWK